MADDNKQAPRTARERTPGKADADTASDQRVAGSAGDDKDQHVITGTGIAVRKIDGREVSVMTDRPDNAANDADLGKPVREDDKDKDEDDDKK